MRTCSLLIASPSAGFLPRIAQMIKLPTSVWTSVAPLSSSAAKARASVIGAMGLPVRGLVIVVQIRSSGIPRAFISLTRLRWSGVGSNFGCPRPLFSLIFGSLLVAKIKIFAALDILSIDTVGVPIESTRALIAGALPRDREFRAEYECWADL